MRGAREGGARDSERGAETEVGAVLADALPVSEDAHHRLVLLPPHSRSLAPPYLLLDLRAL
eukprot:292891-Rhodomonas_salina.1